MTQNRTNMNFKLPPECPHSSQQQLATLGDIKKLGKHVNVCASCDCVGPNLWICLQRSCLRTGCSEQANDHSTQHFQQKSSHCVHMNLSSQRVWCYLCEREVFLSSKPTAPPNTQTAKQPKTSDYHQNHRHDDIKSDDSDAEDEEFEKEEEEKMSYSGLLGLQNIANTCYMNSALQALSNIQPMTHYFLNCSELVEHSVDQSAQRSKAGLAKSYQRLMRDIWGQNSSSTVGGGKDYITPRGILYGIRSVHPMFRGFQQHDTQEFLRCFMDQLHEELKEQIPNSPLLSSTVGSDTEKELQQQSLERLGNVEEEEEEDEEEEEEEDSAASMSSSPCHSSSPSETEYETCDSSVSDSHFTSVASPFVTKVFGPGIGVVRSPRNTSTGVFTTNDMTSLRPQPTTQQQARSIISDIFDGKLLSSVQCLKCNRISTREETFQDLSLPIPNRDYLNVLHQTHSISAQSLSSIDSIGSRSVSSGSGSGDSWLSWMWYLVRSWLWGPSVTLHDCMSSFFSADELKGDNMYSCEKCNKLRTGVKYSQILDIPEVLCIHLKRFRHDLSYSSKISSHVDFPLEGLDMRPYLHKECNSRIATYNLVSVICHHGTVGGGHYTCYARNAHSKRWYEFDDQRVTEVLPETVQNCQAYVLFYRKHNPQMELVRTEASDLNATHPVNRSGADADGIRFFIAREWLSRFKTFAEPGPINNWAMLCQHGGLLQSKISLLRQIAVPISQPLWDYLYRTFGGGPAINMLFECESCKRAAEALSRRQHYELAVFTKYATSASNMDADIDASSAIFAISMPWLRKWQQFARGLTHKEPGPIVNTNIEATTPGGVSSFSQSHQSPIRNVRLDSDFAQLNAPLWRFLHGIYGGGPEIILRGSLSEEIEIIDQDEYDDDNNHVNPDLSDTESNIGQQNLFELNDKEQTPQTQEQPNPCLEVKEDEMEPTLPPPNTSTQKERNTKHNRHSAAAESKKSKASAFRSNLRKKTMKNRNAMKNADFFGPKGNYSTHKSSVDLDIGSAYSTDDVFVDNKRETIQSKHSKQSFQQESRNINKKSKKKFFETSERTKGELTNDRDIVTLQKFSYLQETSESAKNEV